MVELADTQDLGSCAFGVRVRLPLGPLLLTVEKEDYSDFSYTE